MGRYRHNREVTLQRAACAQVQSVKADLRLVVYQISSASSHGALQPEPAAVLPGHLPKQSLSQPQPRQPPHHLLHQLPHQLPWVLISGTFVLVQPGPLSGFLQKQLHIRTVH